MEGGSEGLTTQRCVTSPRRTKRCVGIGTGVSANPCAIPNTYISRKSQGLRSSVGGGAWGMEIRLRITNSTARW